MNSRQPAELPIPTPAISDEDAVEMIRAWIANDQLVASLKIGAWGSEQNVNEEHAWGRILSDLVRMLATALQSNYGGEQTEIVHRLWERLTQELELSEGKSFPGTFLE